MNKTDLKFISHKRNVIGPCIQPNRKAVDCDSISNYRCDRCGWCYEVEAERKKKIRKETEVES